MYVYTRNNLVSRVIRRARYHDINIKPKYVKYSNFTCNSKTVYKMVDQQSIIISHLIFNLVEFFKSCKTNCCLLEKNQKVPSK